MKLYDFPRSTASYRVRIACNLKGITPDKALVNFRDNAQRSDEYLELAPAGLVPSMVEDDGFTVSQSLAILLRLDSMAPTPQLIPNDPRQAALVWEGALTIACDIHPLNNLRILKYLENELDQDEAARDRWYANWIRLGFEALEKKNAKSASNFLVGDELSMADICLVPQMYNARRFNVPLDAFPRLVKIDQKLCAMSEFAAAAPEQQ